MCHGGSISRLNGWPVRTPVNASCTALPPNMHDSEPVWIASPSLYETFIHNTLPAFTGALNDWNVWNRNADDISIAAGSLIFAKLNHYL